MALSKSKVLEYLLYILSVSYFIGKSYKVVAALIIILFFVDVVQKRRWEIFKDPIFIILALWCTYLFSSSIWATHSISAIKGSLELFIWCLLYLAIRFTLVTKDQIEKFMKVQAFIVLFVALSAIVQFFIGFNLVGIPIEAGRGVTDPFTASRVLGYILPLWIALFGSILASKGHDSRTYLFYSIALIALLVTIPLTGSRGPLIIMAIFLPLIAWMSPYRKFAFIALGGILVSLVFLISTTPFLQERLQTMAHPFENQKHYRVPIWLVAIEEFKDNPILGVGFRNYRYREFEYYQDSFESYEINPETGSIAFHAHNPWLDILSEQGIVGLLFALSLLFVVAKIVYRNGAIVMIGSMGVWYAFSLLNSGFVLSSGRWSFFMILAISFFAIIVNYKKLEQDKS